MMLTSLYPFCFRIKRVDAKSSMSKSISLESKYVKQTTKLEKRRFCLAFTILHMSNKVRILAIEHVSE